MHLSLVGRTLIVNQVLMLSLWTSLRFGLALSKFLERLKPCSYITFGMGLRTRHVLELVGMTKPWPRRLGDLASPRQRMLWKRL